MERNSEVEEVPPPGTSSNREEPVFQYYDVRYPPFDRRLAPSRCTSTKESELRKEKLRSPNQLPQPDLPIKLLPSKKLMAVHRWTFETVSPVFKQMITKFEEELAKEEGTISKLKGMQLEISESVFDFIIDFVYWQRLPDGQTSLEFLETALNETKVYQINGLEDAICSKIHSQLTIDNAVDALLVANELDLPDLREKIRLFFCRFGNSLTKKPFLSRIPVEDMLRMTQKSEFMIASETCLVTLLMVWAYAQAVDNNCYDDKNRIIQYFKMVAPAIRLPLLNKTELLEILDGCYDLFSVALSSEYVFDAMLYISLKEGSQTKQTLKEKLGIRCELRIGVGSNSAQQNT